VLSSIELVSIHLAFIQTSYYCSSVLSLKRKTIEQERIVIKGNATPEETAANAEKHRKTKYKKIGATKLLTSQAGFGCYRISSGVMSHEQALRKALREGINLIDTSANYADGDSETLIGQVLKDLIESAELSRQAVIVASKVGYLQGQNFALSRQREQQGRPFKELVMYDKGLEHCIHPEFLQDQLDRSLKRLNLETLDFYLLHNPEYYLGWAHKNKMPIDDSRTEYYRRIRNAFEHLETEVENGRIRYYGISSNTFPAAVEDPEFTCLETVWEIAESLCANHNFRLIQLPMNLLESGAVLEKNQPCGQSVLQFAHAKKLGVLINRPLNAFGNNQLIRLAEIETTEKQSHNDIIQEIRALAKSENVLVKKILPLLELRQGLQNRIREQFAISDALKHYWLNFGSYEHWRQVTSSFFKPRIQGVMDFLKPYAKDSSDVSDWMTAHTDQLETTLNAVGSIYAEAAARKMREIRRLVASADTRWAEGETLSQRAIRAVRSTKGVSCVLVGMRREDYVIDVLAELQRPVPQKKRLEAWQTLSDGICAILS
jgi:aryl-alcohol dehydrogenase-like predicted oxidoreductase